MTGFILKMQNNNLHTNTIKSIHTKMACTYGTSHFYMSIIFQGKVLTDSGMFFLLD